MSKAYGIFEGGGAKGLAHVGALKATEEANIEYVGVAGASAGAIVASLVSVGYKADELFIPKLDYQNQVFDVNFITKLGRIRWTFITFVRFFEQGWKVYLGVALLILLPLIIFIIFHILVMWLYDYSLGYFIFGIVALIGFILVLNFLGPFGLFSTKKIEEWLNEKLCQKIFPGEKKTVKFADLKTPLKIIVTDLKTRRPIVFCKENYPDFSVAKAVSYSISIPIAFIPHFEQNFCYVDGGVLSNFPAWVFDEERQLQTDIISTIGFKLYRNNTDLESSKRRSIKGYMSDLTNVFFGDNLLQIRAIQDLYLIPINVSAHTLDFNLTKQQKIHLFNEGYIAADNFLKQSYKRKNEGRIKFYLQNLHSDLIQKLPAKKRHLRINISLPVEPYQKELRISYSYNMEKDTDDRMVLGKGVGAIGKCWETKLPVLVDMNKARANYDTEWKMSKYQQALVRNSLKSLISIPLFDNRIGASDDIVAVLSLDSDYDLMDNFSKLSGNSETEFSYTVEQFAKYIVDALME